MSSEPARIDHDYDSISVP